MTLHLTEVADRVAAPASASEIRNQNSQVRLYRDRVKRALDLVLTVSSALLWLPIVLVLAAVVATDRSNPFYTQKRVGRDGRIFRMIKLRTMVPGADKVLATYLAENPDAKAEWDATQKLKFDPRITKIGRILRVTSMDELPQLLNVIKGDMSLVGPRPFMESQKSLYPGLGYYRVRPGLTGLWQVSDRNGSTFAYRAVLDDEYDRTLSFGTDLRILRKTVKAVVACTGY